MKSYLNVVVLVFVLFSCNTNDDNATQNDEPILYKSWSLVNVSGGLAGVDDDFEAGLITWDFDLETQKLTVANANMVDVIFDGFETGVYDYAVLSSTGEDASVVVNTFSFNIQTLTTSELILDEGIAFDGFLLTFVAL